MYIPFKNRIEKSINEKDVENIYREEFSRTISDAQITSPYAVDGLLESGNVRLLLEFKCFENLKNKLTQCNILIQCLYYLKKFEDNGQKLPTTIFVGDKNECFAIHTNSIVKYLSSNIDWKIAPSEAHKKNIDLIQQMVSDENITPFVFDINDEFSFKYVIEKVKDFSSNITRKVRITQHNIVTIYDYFDKNVLSDKVKLTTNEKANLFIQIIINPNENYLHPKKNFLVTKSFGELQINKNHFSSFFSHFEGDLYSPSEKENLTSLVDRLVEEETRRKKGEFFTPTAFVDLAHKYISDTFGEDWKEKFIVWDCAWGTGNLTRDYKFKELYCSTLEQSDIDTANQMGYNPEAIKFQFDFLNDDDSKLPQSLRDAIDQGKEILFLINPPYGTASANKSNKIKTNIAVNEIQKLMINIGGFGDSQKQLYTQFLFKICQLQEKEKKIKIALFSPPVFITGKNYDNFYKYFIKYFSFKNGFLFEASHFSEVSKNWGISFTLFDNLLFDQNILLDVVEYDENFYLTTLSKKNLEPFFKIKTANKWVRKKNKTLKCDFPQLSSHVNLRKDGGGSWFDDAIGFFYNAGNSVETNTTNQSIFTAPHYGNSQGFPFGEDILVSVVTLFSARKMITQNWINCKDEYLAPNEGHEQYQQFSYDSLVYSLFNNSSQQSSLRQVEYKEQLWDIKNEFFWLSKDEMIRLGEENNYDELYRDARNGEERYVYKILFQDGIYERLSPDARLVLDTATDLLRRSIQIRHLVSNEHPEYHLNSFDAGYAQLKLVWKEYFKDDFKQFRELYKNLEDRMRPLVYELGFLKK